MDAGFFSLGRSAGIIHAADSKKTRNVKYEFFTGENSVFSSIEIDYILTGNLSNVITGICGNNIREKFQ